ALPRLLCREWRHWTPLPGKRQSGLFGRDRVRGPTLTCAGERKPLVAVLGDFGALPAISADAFRAEIRQEAARLALDVGAHVPGIGAGHQSCVYDLCDMGAPYLLRLRCRLDGR